MKYKSCVVHWDSKAWRVIDKQDADKQRSGKQKRLPEHIYRFDSTLEFNVYLKLIKMYSVSRVKRQHPVLYIPPGECYPKGKLWKVDFAIRSSTYEHDYSFYIEAKGAITADFRDKMPILEHTNPEVFRRLFLIFGSRIPVKSKVVRNLLATKHIRQIYTLKKFQQLEKL